MSARHNRAYGSTTCEQGESQEAHLEQGVELVRRLAFRMARRLPANVDVDDLIGAGMEGLVKAMDGFDPTRGIKFESYAKVRIRGAILDELRSGDTLTRYGRSRMAGVTQAIVSLQQSLGREPREEEIADELGVPLQEYQRLIGDLGQGPLLAGLGAVSPDEVASDDYDPSAAYDEMEARARLARAIMTLPKRHQEVLALYYQEECTQAEVAEILGVSESRVCQLLGETTARLRSKLGRRGLARPQSGQ